MSSIDLFLGFQNQEQSLAYLERVRWDGRRVCPYCGSEKARRHQSSDRHQQRWQCGDCSRAFSVTVGTLFHRTHIPLQHWFLVIALTLDTEKSWSSCKIADLLQMRQPTVWKMVRRIREIMEGDNTEQIALIKNIVQQGQVLGYRVSARAPA